MPRRFDRGRPDICTVAGLNHRFAGSVGLDQNKCRLGQGSGVLSPLARSPRFCPAADSELIQTVVASRMQPAPMGMLAMHQRAALVGGPRTFPRLCVRLYGFGPGSMQRRGARRPSRITAAGGKGRRPEAPQPPRTAVRQAAIAWGRGRYGRWYGPRQRSSRGYSAVGSRGASVAATRRATAADCPSRPRVNPPPLSRMVCARVRWVRRVSAVTTGLPRRASAGRRRRPRSHSSCRVLPSAPAPVRGGG